MLLESLDRQALAVVRRGASGPLEPLAAGCSHLGRGGLVWLGLAPLVGAGRRPLGRTEGAAISLAAIGTAFAGSTAVARAFGRQRPCRQGVHPAVPCPEGGSFPSDQAAAAFAAAEILGWFEPRLRVWFVGGAALVAISRVAAGVHYPSDVAAGALGGATVGRAARALAAHRTRCVAEERFLGRLLRRPR